MNKNGSATASSRISPNFHLFQEVMIRLVLFLIYMYFEMKEPFVRKIHPDEMWLYRNPRTPSYVPLMLLYPAVIGLAAVVFVANFLNTRDFTDFKCAWLGFTLADTLNGVITHSIKVAVGRPRPDFFWRCFPDGEMNPDMECNGDSKAVMEGRKSFPSGHSSFAFASLLYLSLYICGKLHVFTERGRGQSWRLIAAGSPLLIAAMVAISRTCDYHHHWQDVTVGSVIGLIVGYLCYRQYYPSTDSHTCYLPYACDAKTRSPCRKACSKSPAANTESQCDTKALLEGDGKEDKWT